MTDQTLGQKAAENLETVRTKKPLIHNITNFVVMNYTANALLACGASPVMAHAPEEVEEMVSFAGALVLNIGTLSTSWVDAMLIAGKKANELKIPIILDPVGSGATRLRTESAKRLINELSVSVIRGNASEVLSLAREGARTKGVDSIHRVDEAEAAALALARDLDATLAITGPVDLITDGKRVCRVLNGHELMGFVTGTGCTATALIGAFLSVDREPVNATATALAYFGLAGERAAAHSEGPGSFQIALLDALFRMDKETLRIGARIEDNKEAQGMGNQA
ncbi:MAG TPA: hydroxyethylthiazole kinase [Desulfobacteraceae bacterium]|nr:hydroxyethylthiazole kinase [Desulfobacteraceae bacterium]